MMAKTTLDVIQVLSELEQLFAKMAGSSKFAARELTGEPAAEKKGEAWAFWWCVLEVHSARRRLEGE